MDFVVLDLNNSCLLVRRAADPLWDCTYDRCRLEIRCGSPTVGLLNWHDRRRTHLFRGTAGIDWGDHSNCKDQFSIRIFLLKCCDRTKLELRTAVSSRPPPARDDAHA